MQLAPTVTVWMEKILYLWEKNFESNQALGSVQKSVFFASVQTSIQAKDMLMWISLLLNDNSKINNQLSKNILS